jgi:outer membrane protein insertion porin family
MDYTRFFTTYRLERFDLEPQSNSSIEETDPVFDDFPRLLSGVTLNIIRDNRDNTFHPSSGTRHSVTAEYAGGLLGGSTDFQKYRLSTEWSMPSFLGFNLTLKAKGGIVTGYGDPSTVPINEKFILGGVGPGIEGLRGYNDRSVGPIVDGVVTRGRSFLLLTAEEELKITNQVYGILFFDAGNAWESFSAADPTDLKRGLGFGVRVEIPGMGPLGLDIGYGLDRPGGPGFEPHVTFGAFF